MLTAVPQENEFAGFFSWLEYDSNPWCAGLKALLYLATCLPLTASEQEEQACMCASCHVGSSGMKVRTAVISQDLQNRKSGYRVYKQFNHYSIIIE